MSKHRGRNTEFAKMRRIMARLEYQLNKEKEERAKKKSKNDAISNATSENSAVTKNV